MNQDYYEGKGSYRSSYIFKFEMKHKKGKEAKNWETQYKNIWSGKRR